MGIVVLDVGTSSMRGIFYSNEGKKCFTNQISYSPVYLEGDRAEQDPEDWRRAMRENLKACRQWAEGCGEQIEAISLTSQRSSVIPVDEAGKPAAPAIMWQDKRVTELAKKLSPYNSRIFELTGSQLNPVFSGLKMAWIRACAPELYKKARRLVVIPDYLIHEMTGSWVSDATYGSRSLLMNLRTRAWDRELLELFGVEEEKLCPIIEPGSVAGYVKKQWAEETGLPVGIPVISAGGDQQCAALGMGVIRQGAIEISAGTGAYIIAASDRIPEQMGEDVTCNASAIPGAYILESSVLSCASAFNWLLRLCYGMREDNRSQVYELVNREMEESLKREDSLAVLPFFQGRGTPDWNSSARGVFHNMTLGTRREDMARALLEGLGYEIAANVDTIRSYVGPEGPLYACGGLVNSPVFRRILAGACGCMVRTYQDQEAAGIGGWMSAAVALGIFGNYEEAFAKAREDSPFEGVQAEEALVKRCKAGKEAYERLYEKLYRERPEER